MGEVPNCLCCGDVYVCMCLGLCAHMNVACCLNKMGFRIPHTRSKQHTSQWKSISGNEVSNNGFEKKLMYSYCKQKGNELPRQKSAVPLTQLQPSWQHITPQVMRTIFSVPNVGSPELGYCEFAVVVIRCTLKFIG